jgi:hypothetical protein
MLFLLFPNVHLILAPLARKSHANRDRDRAHSASAGRGYPLSPPTEAGRCDRHWLRSHGSLSQWHDRRVAFTNGSIAWLAQPDGTK